MKTSTLHFISFFCTSVTITITLVIFGATGTAKAQNTHTTQNNVPHLNQSVLNGLFSPTASERFLKQGRLKMEREIQILANPERYKPENILQTHTTDRKVIEEIEKTKPISDFPEDILQQKLD